MSECAPLYQPLHPDRDEIRLLTVKLSENSKIECSLEIVSLTDNPKYAGLSYVWGDPNATEEITIDKLSVKVGTNLAAALRRTPRAWAESFPGEGVETFRLWADALCINQQDLAEKSEQIQKMAKIYTQASVVFGCLWLGNLDGCDISLAFQTIETIHNGLAALSSSQSLDVSWMAECPIIGEKGRTQYDAWKNLAKFGKIQYFQRVWILQECVLPSNLIFLDISNSIAVETVETVLVWLDILRAQWNTGRVYGLQVYPLGIFWRLIMAFRGILGFVALWRRTLKSSKGSTSAKIVSSFWTYSIYGLRYQATDPRDHIYGLHAVTKIAISVDYTKPAAIVYEDYVKAWLEHYQSTRTPGEPEAQLWFLVFGGANISLPNYQLPSWAPNYPALARQYHQWDPTFKVWGDAYRDLFGAQTESSSLQNSRLHVTGLEFDTIIAHQPAVEILNLSVLESLTKYQQTDAYTSDLAFCLALLNLYLPRESILADQKEKASHTMWSKLKSWIMTKWIPSEKQTNQLVEYGIGFAWCILDRHLNGQAEAMMDAGDCGREEVSLILTKILRFLGFKIVQFPSQSSEGTEIDISSLGGRLWNMVKNNQSKIFSNYVSILSAFSELKSWNTPLMETAKGYLGTSRPGIQYGDKICILKGCPVPMILREEEGCHVSLGPANIAGIMGEDGVKFLRTGKVIEKEFVIR